MSEEDKNYMAVLFGLLLILLVIKIVNKLSGKRNHLIFTNQYRAVLLIYIRPNSGLKIN